MIMRKSFDVHKVDLNRTCTLDLRPKTNQFKFLNNKIKELNDYSAYNKSHNNNMMSGD
jgi:hypothetical protein